MNAIKALRKKNSITQQELADLLGVDKTTVSKWETGSSFPRANVLPKIAEIFQCTINDLYGESA